MTPAARNLGPQYGDYGNKFYGRVTEGIHLVQSFFTTPLDIGGVCSILKAILADDSSSVEHLTVALIRDQSVVRLRFIGLYLGPLNFSSSVQLPFFQGCKRNGSLTVKVFVEGTIVSG